jgi:hypothetical protein
VSVRRAAGQEERRWPARLGVAAMAAPAGAVVALVAGAGGHHSSTPVLPAGSSRAGADCRRPYTDSSPWNTPVGRAPALDPRGPERVRAIGGRLTSDPTQYTYPVYAVGARTRRETVRVHGRFAHVRGRGGRTLRIQREGTVRLPIPAGAAAAAGSDAQIILVNRATGDEWGAWRLRGAPGRWEIENGYRYNTRWSGVPPRDRSGRPFVARGAGVPYLAGLVRPCEIARGRISHALAFAYDAPGPTHVYPATKSDGNGTAADLPEGARLQLDPAIGAERLRSWGCTGACLVIARALQRYGMFVVDNSGRPKVMAEYDATARWGRTLDADTVSPIPLSAFRVLRSEARR